MNVVPFSFHTHTVRVVMRDGEPWFVATDVCAALEYANSRDAVATHLDDDERMTVADSDSHSGKRGGRRLMTIINESGLYALVLRSRKPEARKFAKWVTSEVLPSIRKTGSYQATTPALAEPELPPLTATLNEDQLYTVWFLMQHFRALFEIYRDSKLYNHLTGLGSRIGIEMHDHFLDGMGGGVGKLERSTIAPQLNEARDRMRAKFSDTRKTTAMQQERSNA